MFKLQTPAKTKSGWRTLADGNWRTRESAEAYGLKYHTTKDGSRLFRIVEA
ncbi:hypothetical protein [Sphingopyxis indica]|uniref:Uncharacterized protein n=1 Tax=Sphingopyxis indica TaxID=436663 RepID=A0A239LTL3_9SPHN|nr:hypothetical protein [Sphingopyxis indica]SNT33133.1 hypothetical protein SAMN06295955_1363 [Sphingopyxis indica]